MNQQGQRETNGELGDFCVTCHAPVALMEGLTSDGLNMAEVPAYAKGVTCAFCHLVDEVQGTLARSWGLADDLVMRGAYADPVPNTGHASACSSCTTNRSSRRICGTRHDIVTPRSVHRAHLPRVEVVAFARRPGERQTCGDCHMKGRTGTAAGAPGVKLRRIHDHHMVGVDVALTPFGDGGPAAADSA